MKFTKEFLKQIIAEEIDTYLNEQGEKDAFVDPVEIAAIDALVRQGIKNQMALRAKYPQTPKTSTAAVPPGFEQAADLGPEEDEALTARHIPLIADDPEATQDDPVFLQGMLDHGLPRDENVVDTILLGVEAINVADQAAARQFKNSFTQHPRSIRQKIKNFLEDLI